MERVGTNINGITTTSEYREGDCCSLVNLRPKNGSLHPVPHRKVVKELYETYDIVFVHQNNNYKNWIGIKNSGYYSSVYYHILDDNPQSVGGSIQSDVKGIEQIGNTLALVTPDNIYYLLFRDNRYIFLGELPEMPSISFSTSDQMSRAKHYFVNEYGAGNVHPSNFISATKGLVNKAMHILMYGDGNGGGGFGMQLFDACFVRYAFRLYDNTLTKHSPPILIIPSRNILNIKTIAYDFDAALRNESYVEVYGYRIYMFYDFYGFDQWEDIIQSVDLFMSLPLGVSNIENIRMDMPTSDSPNLLHYDLIKEITPEAMKNVTSASNLYFLRSIPLGSISNWDGEPLPSNDNQDDISRLDNLVHQEVMSDDNMTHHKYGAACSYAYNSRLHIGNIRTTFFKGFSPAYFQWGNCYNGVVRAERTVEAIYYEVELELGSDIKKVYAGYAEYFSTRSIYASAFLCYPDVRAKRLNIYHYTNNGSWDKRVTVPLTPHNFLNLAYYVEDKLNPISSNMNQIVTSPNYYGTVYLDEPNKIKVSELNNPLSFPTKNTYYAGTGTIMAMASNIMNVSDRNYGQFPLYVFTSQGIWNMNVGDGGTVYSSLTAPTYSEAPTTPIIASTPVGVVFTTKRGLRIINGQNVTFITPQIEQEPVTMDIETYPAIEGVLLPVPGESFGAYLNSLNSLVYNPYTDELIICGKDKGYNYILNLETNDIYQSTDRIDSAVRNLYPEMMGIGGKLLKDFSTYDNPDTHVSLILRPMIYGTPDIKKLERVILRSVLYDLDTPVVDKKPVIMLHYSNDGVNFKAIRGIFLNNGSYKDLDMGMFARSKYRQFLFSFAGQIDSSSRIDMLETMIEKEYGNSKMR